MVPKSEWGKVRRKCQVCGEMMTCRKSTQVHRGCIPAFVRQRHGEDYYQRRAAATREACAARHREQALARWSALAPDVPPDVVRRIYEAGYQAGHQTAMRWTRQVWRGAQGAA